MQRNKWQQWAVCLALGIILIGQKASAETALEECTQSQLTGYKTAACVKEGLIPLEKNDKWGFANKAGKVVIPIQYNDA